MWGMRIPGDIGEIAGVFFYLGVCEQQRLRTTGLWKIHIAFDIVRLNLENNLYYSKKYLKGENNNKI
jgi:hypothetical protein